MTSTHLPLTPVKAPMPLVTDLLSGAEALATRLEEALSHEQWLDAYLLAAGLGQIIEDRLHPDPFLLNRAASYLRGQPSRAARLAGAAAQAAAKAVRAASGPPSRRMLGRRMLKARDAVTGLAAELAGQLMTGGHPDDLTPLTRAIWPAVPALAGDVVRIPACFHSFDQHPDDMRWLAGQFRRRFPAAGVPVCVVGVRTSGSYLAPLLGAALRATGTPVSVLTCRPARPLLHTERRMLRKVTAAGGLVAICDDPPGSGASLAAAARAIGRAGVPATSIVLLFGAFGPGDDLPPALARWATVTLPWEEWSVHRRLAAGPVLQALSGMLGPGAAVREILPVTTVPSPAVRGHTRARFEVWLADRESGSLERRNLLVEGAGLGYFGRQAMAVAAALPDQVPRVYGFADGLLYRDWLPDSPPAPAGALVSTVTGYVVTRERALPALCDPAGRLGGRCPVWEAAAEIVSRQYGRLGVAARPLLLEPLMRLLLRTTRPAILDGNTDTRNWLPDAAGTLRKAGFYQRTFGHLDFVCYDPVFDLAGSAADPPFGGFEAQVRAAYEAATGERIDGERWLLYRLAQLRRHLRAQDLDGDRVNRLSAEAVHEYLAGLYLRDLPPADGPLCAIDLDGVLECDALGYPATSPTGVLALRALIAHGYRPVLVSGRPLADIRHRCTTFGLAGGVAEYGAVLCTGDEVADLRSPADAALLEDIRRGLAGLTGVRIDPASRYAVRATTGKGAVPAELLAAVPALAAPGVRVIAGQGQTDITAAGFGKGTGLTALASRLGNVGCALAVGDTAPDLAMFAEAAMARAPRNARLGPGGADIRLTRGAYQAGLADACADLLGHRPGGCPVCRPGDFAPRTRALLALLDLRAGGLATVLGRTAAVGGLLARRAI